MVRPEDDCNSEKRLEMENVGYCDLFRCVFVAGVLWRMCASASLRFAVTISLEMGAR